MTTTENTQSTKFTSITPRGRLQFFTDDLLTLYWQDLDGEPIDPAVKARVLAARLSDGDLWDVFINYWPHDGDITELSNDLAWFLDSPIWRDGIPVRRTNRWAR